MLCVPLYDQRHEEIQGQDSFVRSFSLALHAEVIVRGDAEICIRASQQIHLGEWDTLGGKGDQRS